jgi:hypothetical protein
MHAIKARAGGRAGTFPQRPSGARSRRLLGVAAGVAAGLALVPAGAEAAQLTATPSNLSSVFAGAQGGDTISLAGGNYGTFGGGSKPSTVTLKPQSGAAVTIGINFNGASNVRVEGVTVSSADVGGTTKNVTIAKSNFTGNTVIRSAQMSNANVVFDGNTHNNISPCSSCYEGRITLPGRNESAPSGVTIKNSVFAGGMSDGIQNGSNGTQILNNEFRDMVQASAAHTDALQLYGSKNTVVRGNYMHNVATGIMAPDGADHEVIEDNVILTSGYPWAILMGGDSGSVIRHNTLPGGACSWSISCGTARIVASNAGRASTGTVVKDNIIGGYDLAGSLGEVNYNLVATGSARGSRDLIGKPAFTGGGSPSTFAGYALASGSAGKANASEGADRGIRVAGAAPAPTPAPTPAPGDKPAVATWTAPAGARVGTAVTLDGTKSTGDGTLTCTWSFENADGSALWETRSGCRISMTFTAVGTKYVKLTVKDADGDTNASKKSFAVAAASAPADKPAVASWTAPVGARVGTAVTLDGTTSTGDGTLTCTWSFENADGSTVWETRPGCRIAMTFTAVGTKYVKLTVTDADGDTNASKKSFAVAA